MASISFLSVALSFHQYKKTQCFHYAYNKRTIICSSSKSKSMAIHDPPQLIRRSANYQESLWSYHHLQSLSSKYTGEVYMERAYTLKEVVKKMIMMMIRDLDQDLSSSLLRSLELVDNLQRLGISYHFEEEISNILEIVYHQTQDKWDGMDLNLKALGFRLLRQHGYPILQDIFRDYKDRIQNLKPCLYEDMVGILNLYEASYLSFEDESILDEARDFTTRYLQENLEKMNQSISPLVSHALETPLHWRVPRVESRWFIDHVNKKNSTNTTNNPIVMLELAKLDFDMVQAIHLEDLKHTSRWWRNIIKWDKKFSFARDRLVESFMWTVGINYLPRFTLARKTLTKVIALITTIDDVYDVYGTLEELEQFTNVISRWDLSEIEELPDYMKLCYLGFYNSINEIIYETLTEKGFLILDYLKKSWADLCKSYLVEARWYHKGYTPTLEEYLENACVSITGPLVLMHVKFLTSIDSIEEIRQCIERSDIIVRYSTLIFRLADDLGTSSDEMARGDISKSVQCYMHESGATEDEARTYMKMLMIKTWKKLNKERGSVNSKFLQEFFDSATNLVRTAQFMYSEGDGHGRPDVIKSHVLSLLVNPIQGLQ